MYENGATPGTGDVNKLLTASSPPVASVGCVDPLVWSRLLKNLWINGESEGGCVCLCVKRERVCVCVKRESVRERESGCVDG